MPDVAIIIPLGFFGMVTLITAMGLGYSYLTNPRRLGGAGVQKAELEALRFEVAKLREQNNTLILAYDQLHTDLERRLEGLERRVALTSGQHEEQPQLAGRV
jgi:hypothetical protein